MKTKGDLVNELCDIRRNWTHRDYVDAYDDEWEYVPLNTNECMVIMEEYIFHTYDADYIKEVIENEKCYVK